MKILRIVLPMFLAGLACFGLFLTINNQSARAADPPEEAALHPAGAAYEINRGPNGSYWVSDLIANEIWQLQPANGTYTRFLNITAPSDARSDLDGHIWWGDNSSARFGQLNINTGEIAYWQVPGATALQGTQVDDQGAIWLMAFEAPYLYHFDPGSQRLCTYNLPDEGVADYALVLDNMVWLGDRNNHRLLRLDPDSGTFTLWPLPPGSQPVGISASPDGAIWYADPVLAYLGRYQPGIELLDVYSLPVGSKPEMLTVQGNNIWYSEQWDGTIGKLTPELAGATHITLTHSSLTTAVSCTLQTTVLTNTVTMVTGTLTWNPTSYPVLMDESGWLVYDLPTGALPWGLAADNQHVWFIDTNRHLVGRIPQEAPVSLTACVLADADGNLGSSTDQSPLTDWLVYLRIAGVRQEPGRRTGPDGCVRWTDLAPGPSYGLEEQLVTGWEALTPASHDFSPSLPGDQFENTFINYQTQSFLFLPLLNR